ncbi:MAG TPA: hypothetical protein VLE46_00325 [Nitrospira sp.]|nr:hypothetical protein [Nitrospira sp.]
MTPLRKEIRDFVSACETLLSPYLTSGDEPLSHEERDVILYYLEELKRLTTSVETIPQHLKGSQSRALDK